jgi:hypothetical protein
MWITGYPDIRQQSMWPNRVNQSVLPPESLFQRWSNAGEIMKIFILLFWNEKKRDKEGSESWLVLTRSCRQASQLALGYSPPEIVNFLTKLGG